MRDDDIDDTVVRRPRTEHSVDRLDDALGDTVIRPVPPLPGMPSGPDPSHDPFGDTVIRPVPPIPGTNASPPSSDDVDDTVIRAVRSVPAAPGASRSATSDQADDTLVRPGRAPRPADDAVDDTLVGGRTQPGDQAGVPAQGDPRLPSERPGPSTRVPSVRIGGRVIRLDHPVIVGRRPALPRILRGPSPELVSVPSPSGQVSSSHVLLHAEGEAAVVDDLRSTNGTVVRPAGSAPFRMPSGASNVVLTGTVVEIGDGNVIEVLSPHLRVAPSSRDLPPLPTWPTDPPAGTPRTPRERS
ncbi:hypothetical protein ACQXVK_08855 [Curtobacterium sp. AB451]|uniref:hypothetical protein n=1 Tax=Curtobacterium sp. AB451 TaxID=3422306 RepID=UPI003D33B5E5